MEKAGMGKIVPPNFIDYSSTERPEAVIKWIIRYDNGRDFELAPVFWQIVRDEWDGFDRIDHRTYERLFTRCMRWMVASTFDLRRIQGKAPHGRRRTVPP
jgi:hypothetical protein